MKKVVAFMISLLLFVSSLQLCSATDIDSGDTNNLNTHNGYPIIIQVPPISNPSKDSKNKKYKKDIAKYISSSIKWLTIVGGAVFLYNKYHEPVEKFVGKTTEKVEKMTDGVASLTNVAAESGGAIANVTAERLNSAITLTECVAGGAVLSYFITAVAGLITAIASCLPKAPVVGQ